MNSSEKACFNPECSQVYTEERRQVNNQIPDNRYTEEHRQAENQIPDDWNPAFSHIYVERAVMRHPGTLKILERFPHANVIEITHYKDVFCRKRQRVALQNRAPKLILAAKREHFIYRGAPVCQFFGESYFYYTSCVMNCLYDCEYCYLKGMYPSGNLVVFVNIEEYFSQVRQLLRRHPVYLCVSYDTDLMALESLTGYVRAWTELAREERQLRIECRTKCSRTDLWGRLAPDENVIFAFTLSPAEVIEKYEHRTPPLADRLRSIRAAMEAGFPVRLCFDPMIYLPGWRECYSALAAQTAAQIGMGRVRDVSIGSFRISQDYLKKLRRALPRSAVVQFPFENEAGVYHYPDRLMREMEEFMAGELGRLLPENRIFRWRDA